MSLRTSVVIPVYNGAAFLPDALASVRAQTRPADEVFVVDDASSDGSAALARTLGATVIEQPSNQGPSAARNAGIAAATGDVIAFLDADDAWLPWHLEFSVGALAAHPAAAVACTEVVPWETPPPPRPPDARVELPEDPSVVLLRDPFIAQAAAVVRRRAVQQAGGYDVRMRHAEDFDLWLRLAAHHQVARVRAPGLRRRSHPGQATHASQRMIEGGFSVRLRTLDAIRRSGDAPRTARAAAAVADALDADLHAMWYVRDAVAFRYLLTLADRVPGADRVRRRWALRRSVGWHLYGALRALKQRARRAPQGHASGAD